MLVTNPTETRASKISDTLTVRIGVLSFCTIKNQAFAAIRLCPSPVLPLMGQFEYMQRCQICAAPYRVTLSIFLDIMCKNGVIYTTGST